jgi:hypothetical protein
MYFQCYASEDDNCPVREWLEGFNYLASWFKRAIVHTFPLNMYLNTKQSKFSHFSAIQIELKP